MNILYHFWYREVEDLWNKKKGGGINKKVNQRLLTIIPTISTQPLPQLTLILKKKTRKTKRRWTDTKNVVQIDNGKSTIKCRQTKKEEAKKNNNKDLLQEEYIIHRNEDRIKIRHLQGDV